MEVISSYPPNILDIQEVLPINPKAVYTYGQKLYSPRGDVIDRVLMAHEEHHAVQQGTRPKKWWKRYLKDPAFRLEQELAAYRVQYAFFKELYKDRNYHASFLHHIASDLASPMYGDLVTYDEAKKLIRNEP